MNEFIIDLQSSNVRMYQGTINKDIHFDFFDGSLDKTTFTSNLTTTTISPSGTTALSVSSSAVSIVPLTTFTQNNIIVAGAGIFNIGYGAGGSSNVLIGAGVPRTIVFTNGGNTIIGNAAGAALTIGARDSTLIGVNAGDGITSGQYNTHIGSNAGNQVSGTGNDNTSCGYIALGAMITTARGNSAFGSNAGAGITTGQFNTFCGYGAGSNVTTGSRNIIIGETALGTAGADNQIILGSTRETMFIQGGFNWRVGGQITNSTNGNLTGIVLAQFYSVAMTTTGQTITLPNPNNAAYLGACVTFKRKTNTTIFTFTAAGTNPFLGSNSVTPVASPTSITAGIFQVDMVCDGTNWCFIGIS
jgi:hypothetical protein